MLLRMVDSDRAPTDADVEQLDTWFIDAVAGYIGGRAAVTWTREDFERVNRVGWRILPVWVGPRNGTTHAQGAEEGNLCLQAMQSFGLSGTVALDVEADSPVSADWVAGFVDATVRGSLGVVLYCNPDQAVRFEATQSLIGFWIAAWGSSRPIDLVPLTVAWQYASSPRWDFSVLAGDVSLATLEPAPF